MTNQTKLGGTFTLPGTSMTLNRMGYGAMQLAGPHMYGDRRAIGRRPFQYCERPSRWGSITSTPATFMVRTSRIRSSGRRSIPIQEDLVIVTKVGARRGEDKSWLVALSRKELTDAIHDNLRNLGRDTLDVVNLRVGEVMGPTDASIEEPLAVLADLKQQGLIRHIGLSNVNPRQFAEAQTITDIVCVQNLYNVSHRRDDGFIEDLAQRGVAFMPFFPLGGFTPLQSSVLDAAAASVAATPMQVALAWLLQRAPNILLIPGTSSVKHLRENLSSAALPLPPEIIADLDTIGGVSGH